MWTSHFWWNLRRPNAPGDTTHCQTYMRMMRPQVTKRILPQEETISNSCYSPNLFRQISARIGIYIERNIGRRRMNAVRFCGRSLKKGNGSLPSSREGGYGGQGIAAGSVERLKILRRPIIPTIYTSLSTKTQSVLEVGAFGLVPTLERHLEAQLPLQS
jgi:hypothetical protein